MTRTRLSRTIAPGSIAALALLLVAGATLESHAQSQFNPYYGKNRVKYDHFDWHIYTTDHFEIYYYPELEEHLERVASYAESAYEKISAALRHDLAEKIPWSCSRRTASSSSRISSRATSQKGCWRLPSRNAAGWCSRLTNRPISSTG